MTINRKCNSCIHSDVCMYKEKYNEKCDELSSMFDKEDTSPFQVSLICNNYRDKYNGITIKGFGYPPDIIPANIEDPISNDIRTKTVPVWYDTKTTESEDKNMISNRLKYCDNSSKAIKD